MSDSSSDIEVISLALYDETGELLIDFVEETTAGRISLGLMEFVESIAETCMRGVISVDITKGEFDYLQLTGNEYVQFKLKNTDENDQDFILTSPMFLVYDFDNSSDNTDLTLLPEGVHGKSLTLKFVSKQQGSVFDSKNPLQYGFVGRIANTQKINQGEYAEDIYAFTTDGEFDVDSIDDDDVPPACNGLINELAMTYFAGEQFEIEGTDNTILHSPQRFTYPNKKITKNMNLLQLINHATKYAWKKSNIIETETDTGSSFSEFGWCNYFFWHDLDGWHFKSATKMAADSKATDIKTFYFSQDVLSESRIRKLDVISDFSISKAFSDGMLYSFYTKIEPEYEDLYARFLNDNSKYKETLYEYNYGSDYNPLIESSRLMPDIVYDPLDGKEMNLVDWIKERKNNELKVDDTLFGHYKNRQFGDKNELYRIAGRGFDVGSTSYDGRYENIEYNPNLSDYNLYQDNMWQEMFDCVDIMGSSDDDIDDCFVLRQLKKIKADTFINKALYRRAMDYKEKWNVYRYSVCCEEVNTDSDEFFAIIKDHKKIGDNIYRYAWSKVVLIPKVELSELVGWRHFLTDADLEAGISSDASYYNLEVAGDTSLNALFLFDDLNEIYWTPHWREFSGGNIESAPFGIYSGKIFFGASAGIPESGPTGPSGSIAFDYIRPLFTGVSAEGLTLTFHNSQYSPFLIVEREDGPKGATNDYTGAYNLNEIMNRKLLPVPEVPNIPGEGEYPEFFEGVDGVIYYQHSPIDFPIGGDYDFSGPTFTDEVLIGPGIQGTGDTGGYPEGFDMMPIGGYKRLGADRTPECDATPFGHIVKMSSVSYEEALQVGIEPRNFPVSVRDKRLFYFASENAHDGNCQGECEL